LKADGTDHFYEGIFALERNFNKTSHYHKEKFLAENLPRCQPCNVECWMLAHDGSSGYRDDGMGRDDESVLCGGMCGPVVDFAVGGDCSAALYIAAGERSEVG
jgi:hypothetical protein